MTKELIAKLKALEEPSVFVFWEVFDVVLHGYDKKTRFRNLLVADAWESAAIMLKPEGWSYLLGSITNGAALISADEQFAREDRANHPAIALLICILEVRDDNYDKV